MMVIKNLIWTPELSPKSSLLLPMSKENLELEAFLVKERGLSQSCKHNVIRRFKDKLPMNSHILAEFLSDPPLSNDTKSKLKTF